MKQLYRLADIIVACARGISAAFHIVLGLIFLCIGLAALVGVRLRLVCAGHRIDMWVHWRFHLRGSF
jgi:hypothetical protein